MANCNRKANKSTLNDDTEYVIVDTLKELLEPKSGQAVMGYHEQIDYLENQCWRNNLVINGLGPDEADKTWEETESKVQELLTTKLNLNAAVKERELI